MRQKPCDWQMLQSFGCLQLYSVQLKANPARRVCIKNLDVKTGVGNDFSYQECLTSSERIIKNLRGSCLGNARTQTQFHRTSYKTVHSQHCLPTRVFAQLYVYMAWNEGLCGCVYT